MLDYSLPSGLANLRYIHCCLICLIFMKVPFLPGSSDLDQLSKISETLGTPSEESWPVSIITSKYRNRCSKTQSTLHTAHSKIFTLAFLVIFEELGFNLLA